MKDIGEFCLSKPPGSSLDDKANHYHTMLQTILDKHAPIKSHKLPRPSDSEGALRESGTGTDECGGSYTSSSSMPTCIKPSDQSCMKILSHFHHQELLKLQMHL